MAPGRWILKGGLALDFRLHDRARATIDMDLARQDDEAAANADFRAAQAADLGDYFTFEIARTARLHEADAGGAVRYKVSASLAGRRFEDLVVDVGFADPVAETPDEVIGPDLLAFAELPPVRVPVLTLAQHVAEKVHAYTRRYGPMQRSSSRVKDLIDIVLIQSTSTFQARQLRAALRRTFEARGTHPLPTSWPKPSPDWRVPYGRLASDLLIPAHLGEGYRAAATFLDPILEGSIGDDARWDPELGA